MNSEISIITVVRNSVNTIEDCLNSVLNQSISAQHYVVDACSTDGTLSVLEEYKLNNAISYCSEPDNGIYDAMNKGISKTTGNIIGFINSDDFYAHNHVLKRVINVFKNPDIDACYGDLVYVDRKYSERIVRTWRSGHYTLKSFRSGWMPPHPTFFVRRSIYEKYGLFNLSLNSAADYELMLRFLYKHKVKAQYIPEVLVRMRAGGVSNITLKNRFSANRMDRRAWQVNNLSPDPWTLILKPVRKITQFSFI